MMSHVELMNEVDMLKGNINRICVTDDIEEIESMYKYALKRLEKIHEDVLEKLMIKNDEKLNPWIDVKDKYPEAYRLVKIKFDDGRTATDMLIKGKYGNLERRTYTDKSIKAWREI